MCFDLRCKRAYRGRDSPPRIFADEIGIDGRACCHPRGSGSDDLRRQSETFPAAHTAATDVAPWALVSTRFPIPSGCSTVSTPSDSSSAERASNLGPTTTASTGRTLPEDKATPLTASSVTSSDRTLPTTTEMDRADSCSHSSSDGSTASLRNSVMLALHCRNSSA